jgi:hypothetical protein
MNDTNYIGGVIKILESPKQKILKNNILVTQFRAQIPQFRNTRIVTLTFWGNLARDITTYYKIDDYLIIEGYISLRTKKNSNLIISKSKKIEITVLKVYPFLLSYDRSIKKP